MNTVQEVCLIFRRKNTVDVGNHTKICMFANTQMTIPSYIILTEIADTHTQVFSERILNLETSATVKQ